MGAPMTEPKAAKTSSHGVDWDYFATVCVAWATILKIALMFATMYMRHVLDDGGMQVVDHTLWLFFVVYMNIQLWAIFQRETTKTGQFFVDNALALVGLGVGGIILFLMLFVPWFKDYGHEEFSIVLQCTLWGGTDFLWGILLSQRIAFSGKERQET